MISLVKADLYRETRKKSFVFMFFLVMLVPLSLLVINKNIENDSNELISYPLMNESEYLNVYKYGDYQQYLSDYDTYQELINIEMENSLGDNSFSNLFSYIHNFLFLFGIIVIFIAYNSFSYDLSHGTLKYVFLTSHSRFKVLLSKVFSVFIITVLFALLLLFSSFVVCLCIETIPVFSFKDVFFWGVYFVLYLFLILFTMLFTFLLKGSAFVLVFNIAFYISSLVISQLFFVIGFKIHQFSFLPYLDLTYYSDKSTVLFNNLIYNIDLSICNGMFMLLFYSVLCGVFLYFVIKRDY